MLLAWELGGNLGHWSRLLFIARLVEQAGGMCIWALPAHERQSRRLAVTGQSHVQAPDAVKPSSRVHVLSFASILLNIGFANPEGAALAVARWRVILEEARPDLVVLDSAPMAQLAVCLWRWPALLISNGFDSPPASCPAFGIGMRGAFAERLNAQQIQSLTRSLEYISRIVGSTFCPSIDDYLSYPERYLDCVAETDIYGPRRDVSYTGPMAGLTDVADPFWPSPPHECALHVFVYLRSADALSRVLRAASLRAANMLCVTTEAAREQLPAEVPQGVRITSSPVRLDVAVAQADLVIGYGSFGLMTAARIAGKPQLAMPEEVDKMMLCRRLASDASALWISAGVDVDRAIEMALTLRPAPLTVDGSGVAKLRARLSGSS